MSSKFTTVRLTLDGEHFEILVRPDQALGFKQGRSIEASSVLAADEVFSDSSKGLRVSSEKLMKYFHTNNATKAAEEILRRGDLQITTEQRRGLVEDKRKQIINLIARNYVDPRTGLPHPPTRIEQALSQVHLSIDPFKNAEEQSKTVIDQLRSILPLKSEKIKLRIKVPAQYASQSIGVLKRYSDIQKEEWGSDGSLNAIIEIPPGVQSSVIERLGSLTKGSAQITNVV